MGGRCCWPVTSPSLAPTSLPLAGSRQVKLLDFLWGTERTALGGALILFHSLQDYVFSRGLDEHQCFQQDNVQMR